MPTDINTLTFGVEIECFLPAGHSRGELAAALVAAGVETSAEIYNHRTPTAWKIITDGSLGDYDRGSELVSPILTGEAGFATIATVCTVLSGFGITVDRRCGLHVHVGVRQQGDRVVDLFKNLFALYAAAEPLIDGLVAPSRRSGNNYCIALGNVVPMLNSEDLSALRRANGGTRYRKVNLEAFWRHGTVEFRQHQGTINAEKICAWTRLCLRMVAWAADRAAEMPDPVVTTPPTPRFYDHTFPALGHYPHQHQPAPCRHAVLDTV
jgi:Putative amidoligase enzyme